MLKDRSLLIKVTSEQKGGGRLLIQESILKQSAFCRAEAQSCGYSVEPLFVSCRQRWAL